MPFEKECEKPGSGTLPEQVRQIPQRIRDAGLERRRHPDRPVDATEVVVENVQRRRRLQVLQFLAEPEAEPGEPPHERADRQVVPLDV